MTLHWPQITYAVLLVLSLGIALAKDGESRTPHSFWSTSVGTVICVWLLYKGGFWS